MEKSEEIIMIFAVCFLLSIIYISPVMNLKENVPPEPPLIPSMTDNKGLTVQGRLIMAEHQKVVDEIKQRIQNESKWFELKFYFVGAILLGFFARAVFRNNDSGNNDKGVGRDVQTVLEMLKSPVTLAVLSLAFIVALSIDLHIHSNRMMIVQAGTWLSEYVEPAFLNNYNAHDQRNFVGWEQFLRIAHSHHTDFLYRLTYWAYGDFLTVILYALVLFVLVQSRKLPPVWVAEEKTNIDLRWFRQFVFWLLHIAILFFAFSIHYQPKIFEYNYKLGFEAVDPSTVMIINIAIAFLLIFLSYISFMREGNSGNK